MTRRRAASLEGVAVAIPVGGGTLAGELTVPAQATGIVLFAHGTGSSRHSPRNRYVAGELQRVGVATLLMDLLTPAEERFDEATAGSLRFNIDLLAARLDRATEWVTESRPVDGLPVGYFGASTGAAAALVAAAGRWRESVRAIVSRGGRPDLAGRALRLVQAPTLLIVGGDDAPVLDLNRQAMAALAGPKRLEIVPGATHLFEEQGALETVAALAAGWFVRNLR